MLQSTREIQATVIEQQNRVIRFTNNHNMRRYETREAAQQAFEDVVSSAIDRINWGVEWYAVTGKPATRAAKRFAAEGVAYIEAYAPKVRETLATFEPWK